MKCAADYITAAGTVRGGCTTIFERPCRKLRICRVRVDLPVAKSHRAAGTCTPPQKERLGLREGSLAVWIVLFYSQGSTP